MAKRPTGDAFHFKIAKFTPDTLPMGRLAAYLADLAALLGNVERVHFIKVGLGSADLVHWVEPEQTPQVIERLFLVKQGEGPADAQKAYKSLNSKLREDATSAKMVRGRGKLLFFEGAQANVAPTYGPISQPGTLQGRIIKLGGKDETKPVHIMSKDNYYICNANAEVAKALAADYEEEVRVYGVGKWSRNENSEWCLDQFNISHHERLHSDQLTEVVAELRKIQENGWRNFDDPLGELAAIRNGGKTN